MTGAHFPISDIAAALENEKKDSLEEAKLLVARTHGLHAQQVSHSTCKLTGGTMLPYSSLEASRLRTTRHHPVYELLLSMVLLREGVDSVR